MTIKVTTMYDAGCDATGCTRRSSDFVDGNNRVYAELDQLNAEFSDTREGSLTDSYGWLRIPVPGPEGTPADKHYCSEHTTWDEETDTMVPDPGHQSDPPRATNGMDGDTTESEKA